MIDTPCHFGMCAIDGRNLHHGRLFQCWTISHDKFFCPCESLAHATTESNFAPHLVRLARISLTAILQAKNRDAFIVGSDVYGLSTTQATVNGATGIAETALFNSGVGDGVCTTERFAVRLANDTPHEFGRHDCNGRRDVNAIDFAFVPGSGLLHSLKASSGADLSATRCIATWPNTSLKMSSYVNQIRSHERSKI